MRRAALPASSAVLVGATPEMVTYKIPDRPVICQGAKSRVVTAP